MEAGWESHKELLHDLYLKQSKSLDFIMAYMKDNHGFKAGWVTLSVFSPSKLTM